jgi:5-methylcytosine-specific restriction endonuclease McrA
MAEDRRSDEYWKWRASVVKRDGHKCQYPGCRRRTKLEVHHIVPWASSASLRYVVGNGICLCIPHHNSIKNKESAYAEMFRTIIAQQKLKKKKPVKK